MPDHVPPPRRHQQRGQRQQRPCPQGRIAYARRHRVELEGARSVNGVGYHGSRLTKDSRREIVWQCLWRYRFCAMVRPDDCVLDLGAGYGEFINAAVARRRIAVDSWEGFSAHLAVGVEHRVGSVTSLDFLDDGSVDFAFASNVFEHLTRAELQLTLDALRPKLSARGTLTIV